VPTVGAFPDRVAVEVEHIAWVELFVAGVGAPVTVTETDETLTVLHDGATAVAVITSPETNDGRPIFVHAPEVTVVVPREIPALNNSMIVPLASELVPLSVVEPEQIGEDITGTADGLKLV
jgi:hypothetical protein